MEGRLRDGNDKTQAEKFELLEMLRIKSEEF